MEAESMTELRPAGYTEMEVERLMELAGDFAREHAAALSQDVTSMSNEVAKWRRADAAREALKAALTDALNAGAHRATPAAQPDASVEAVAQRIAAADASGRCYCCGWPLKTQTAEGCVIGNCSFRPNRGAYDYDGWRRRSHEALEYHAARAEATRQQSDAPAAPLVAATPACPQCSGTGWLLKSYPTQCPACCPSCDVTLTVTPAATEAVQPNASHDTAARPSASTAQPEPVAWMYQSAVSKARFVALERDPQQSAVWVETPLYAALPGDAASTGGSNAAIATGGGTVRDSV